MTTRFTWFVRTATLLASLQPLSTVALAQGPNQFGGQDRADAARQMIILGVQQGISSLPPTSGQSFEYEFDTNLGVPVASETLGPTSFRSTQVLAKGKLSVRGAASYFDLSESFAPIKYLTQVTGPQSAFGITGAGSDVSASVGLFNLAATYGLMDRIELTMNVPITIIDAEASQISSTRQSLANLPPNEAMLSGFFVGGTLSTDPATRQEQINAVSAGFDNVLAPPNGPCMPPIPPENCLTYRTDSLQSLGYDFNGGTSAGVGRISLGGKGMIYGGGRDNPFDLSASLELFMPSPSQDEFAGSDTFAILPRLIGQARLHPNFRLHTDVGYDYDVYYQTLRRFVWNFGASVPIQRFVFDAGFGGSLFNQPIYWAPQTATGTDTGASTVTLQALTDTSIGTNYADFLAGIKYRVLDQTVISGAFNLPITEDGFRADAVGTIAVEVYF